MRLSRPRLLPTLIVCLTATLLLRLVAHLPFASGDPTALIATASASAPDQPAAAGAKDASAPAAPPAPANPAAAAPPSGNAPSGNASSGNAPSGNAPSGNAPAGNTSAGNPSGAKPSSGPSARAPGTAVPASIPSAEGLVEELRSQHDALAAREASLDQRASLIAAAEKRVEARLSELAALQKKLEGLEADRKKREDANWQGLVRTYEAMKPREAATILNDLDMPVLLQVLDRMKELKAAAILGAMQPDRARDATTQLAQLRTRRDAAPGDNSEGKP